MLLCIALGKVICSDDRYLTLLENCGPEKYSALSYLLLKQFKLSEIRKYLASWKIQAIANIIAESQRMRLGLESLSSFIIPHPHFYILRHG